MDETAVAESALSQDALARRIPLPLQAALPAPRREPVYPRAATGRDFALAGIAHDARNLVTAIRLCADLIAEPGVLSKGQGHLAQQVQALAEASDSIVRRLSSVARIATLASQVIRAEILIDDLGQAVRQLASLLSAVAGPAVTIEIMALNCPGRLALSEESLTRILLNLVRNAVDAMPVGRIWITVRPGSGQALSRVRAARPEQGQIGAAEQGSAAETVLLVVEDEGPGIPADLIERVFERGFSTHRAGQPWPGAQHRGLGLSIVREVTEAAGGTVRAVPRAMGGACFEVELPLTNVMPLLPSEGTPGDRSGDQ